MKNCNSINTTGLKRIKNLETNQKGFLLYTIPDDYIGVVVYDENIDSGATDTLGVESMIVLKKDQND